MLRIIAPTDETVCDFVRESNAIEGITDTTGPLWGDHLAAAHAVAERPGRFLSRPRSLHRWIMGSQSLASPGNYRRPWPLPFPHQNSTGDVMVGGDLKMPWESVPEAMQSLLTQAREYRQHPPPNDRPLWLAHYEFERIHPFFDGNGRTGRLWMNALRQLCGFPWAIVRADERFTYYSRIREYERNLARHV